MKTLLPVVSIGIAVVVSILYIKSRKSRGSKDREEDFLPMGVALGLPLGAALGSSLGAEYIGLGAGLGMLLGIIIGSNIKKKE